MDTCLIIEHSLKENSWLIFQNQNILFFFDHLFLLFVNNMTSQEVTAHTLLQDDYKDIIILFFSLRSLQF